VNFANGVNMKARRADGLFLVVAAIVMVGGCVGSGQAKVTTGASPTASAGSATKASRTAQPSLPAADAAAIDRATRVILSLGGSVSPQTSAVVSNSRPDGEPGTAVKLGEWLIEWDQTGRLAHVFDALPPYTPTTGGALSESQARARVADILSRLGFSLGTPDSSMLDGDSADWRAQWTRVLDGYPVPGDGTLVLILPDGTFESYSYSETANAPVPTALISQAAAVAKAGRCNNIANGTNGLTETCTVALEWHAPRPVEGQTSLLQLCWRIADSWNDNDQNYGGGVIWFDAGTGDVVDSAAIS
jgi:hypothetical protein